MSLATSLLTLEQVQLLADCIEPVLVLEIPTTAEELLRRGLLISSKVSCDEFSCYFLAVSKRGRSYVTAWLGRQETSRRRTGRMLQPPTGFRAVRPS